MFLFKQPMQIREVINLFETIDNISSFSKRSNVKDTCYYMTDFINQQAMRLGAIASFNDDDIDNANI